MADTLVLLLLVVSPSDRDYDYEPLRVAAITAPTSVLASTRRPGLRAASGPLVGLASGLGARGEPTGASVRDFLIHRQTNWMFCAPVCVQPCLPNPSGARSMGFATSSYFGPAASLALV